MISALQYLQRPYTGFPVPSACGGAAVNLGFAGMAGTGAGTGTASAAAGGAGLSSAFAMRVSSSIICVAWLLVIVVPNNHQAMIRRPAPALTCCPIYPHQPCARLLFAFPNRPCTVAFVCRFQRPALLHRPEHPRYGQRIPATKNAKALASHPQVCYGT